MSKIIIDGYNLLAQSPYPSRDKLIAALKEYQHRQKHKITVFFDGTHQGTGTGDRQIEEHMEIIFSPLTVTADDMIEEYIEKHYREKPIVVSSDRRIQKAASERRLAFLEAKEFLFKMKYGVSGKDESFHLPWMEGRTTDEEYELPNKKKGNPRQKSKREKLKSKTLKKL